MKSSHRFPLRRQIVWGMRFFTILTSLAVGAALFTLSNQYVRANSLQAAEFNLRLVATSIETSLDSADALLNWASIDSTVRRYISQENINGTQTIAAYEAMQEKYYSSTLYSHILRFFVTNENDRHLQFGPLNASAALNRTSIKQFLTKGYGMQFTTDPLLPGSPGCIALSQPVRCGKGTLHRGSTYLALDTAIITDPAAGYSLTDGSALYWEMGSRLWQIENGSLTEIENPLREVDYTLRTGSNNGVTEQTAWQGKVQLDGQKYYVVKVTLNGRSAALVQLLPANTFLLHYGVYLWLVALGIAIIWGLSFLMQHWLERVITRPVEALQKRIETVGSGNFAPDRTVEWNNELGDIGRGINQLAENVDSLMTRRVEDERRKQELEYRMLQNEVNPHFIYNTLNSIRWMATIQHAPGIAEMVTAFARLTKSISKGTQKLVPLQEELALDLNSKTSIRPVRQGVEFVGVRIWPTHMKLRKSTVRRIKREVRKISALYAAGDMTRQDFYRRIASIRGLLKHTESASLRWRLNEIYRAELEKAKQKQLREEAQHEPFADHSGAGNGDGNAGTGYQDHGNPACRAG